MTTLHTTEVQGLNIFYREAGNPAAPKLSCFAGSRRPHTSSATSSRRWPSASTSSRPTIPASATPRCPTRPSSTTPSTASPTIVESFLDKLGFTSRSASTCRTTAAPSASASSPGTRSGWSGCHPERQRLRGRLHGGWDGFRERLLEGPHARGRAAAGGVPAARDHQADLPSRPPRPNQRSAPTTGTWTCSSRAPQRRRVHLDLFYDYRTNVGSIPHLAGVPARAAAEDPIFWGQEDIFFTREGGEAYLQDLPDAEMHPPRLRSLRRRGQPRPDHGVDPAVLRHQGAPRRLRVGGCGPAWARRPATSSPSAARPGSTSTALPGQSSSPPAAASSPW